MKFKQNLLSYFNYQQRKGDTMGTIIRTLFILLMFSTSLIYSQITITQSDYNAIFAVGNTTTALGSTTATSIDIGQPGGNNVWDFSAFVPNEFFSQSYISPAATPHASIFPSANVAEYFTFTFSPDDTTTVTGESWNYISTGTTSLEYGTVSENTNVTPNTQTLIASVRTHFPPSDQYKLPIDFNESWSVNDSTQSENTLNGVSTGTTTESAVTNFIVDAWGTMTLPGGSSFSVLRLREQEISTTYFMGFPVFTNTSVEYTFLSKTGDFFSVSADDENPPNSGTINGTIGWTGDPPVTDVKEITGILPSEFNLSQNYPNPFNPSTLIEYSLTTESFVDLKVYDILGNEVAVLVNEEQNAGTYRANFSGDGLSSGLYIAQITAGNLTQSIKMTLLK